MSSRKEDPVNLMIVIVTCFAHIYQIVFCAPLNGRSTHLIAVHVLTSTAIGPKGVRLGRSCCGLGLIVEGVHCLHGGMPLSHTA